MATATTWLERHSTGVPRTYYSNSTYFSVAQNAFEQHRGKVIGSILGFGCIWAVLGGRPRSIMKHSLFLSSLVFLIDHLNRRRVLELRQKIQDSQQTIQAFRTGLEEINNPATSEAERAQIFDLLFENEGTEWTRFFTLAPRMIATLADATCRDKTSATYRTWFAPREGVPEQDWPSVRARVQAERVLAQIRPSYVQTEVIHRLPRPAQARGLIDCAENHQRTFATRVQREVRGRMGSLRVHSGEIEKLRNQLQHFSNALEALSNSECDYADVRLRHFAALLTLFLPTICWVVT